MLLPVLAACSPGTRETPVELRFDAAGGTTLRSLQFYVYDIELLDEKGLSHPLHISTNLALVDLAGNPEIPHATSVHGTLDPSAPSNYRGIRFTVGVPFELNHANPLKAAAPLDRGDLFWTWQTGYKFIRADYVVDGMEASFHLGSTGCSSASALRPPAAPCAQPNRMRIELAGDPLAGVIRFHPEILGKGTCTGNYAHDPACAVGFASTGLQQDSGQCADPYCAAQKLWTLD
jgi:uncharacterized repeat protein (TIGR04052 family)